MQDNIKRFRHKARGSVYALVGAAELQDSTGEGVREGDILVVYYGEDGKLWARRQSEFEDGRFETWMPPKYSAEWIEQQVGERSWLPIRDCTICGVDIGYIVALDSSVWFRSGCDCLGFTTPDRPASFEEIARALAIQPSDEYRDEIMQKMLGGPLTCT